MTQKSVQGYWYCYLNYPSIEVNSEDAVGRTPRACVAGYIEPPVTRLAYVVDEFAERKFSFLKDACAL